MGRERFLERFQEWAGGGEGGKVSNHNANTLSAPLLVSPPSTEVGGGGAGWSSCLLPSLTHPPTFGGSGELGREGRKGCEGGKEIKELRRRPFLLCAQPKKTVVLTLACHAAMPLARENVPFFSSPHPPPVRRPEPQSAPPFNPAREQT